jgi:hypothetical protein
MIDREQLKALVAQNPQMQQASDQIEQQLLQSGVGPEELMEIVQMLEVMLQNPDKYTQILQAAYAEDVMDPGDLPEQFDEDFIATLLVALYDVVDRFAGQQQQPPQAPQAFARGGLAQVAQELQSKGRYGDTMLAHITPDEARLLKSLGGSGTINPETGLPEYFKRFWKKVVKPVLKVAAPIVANMVIPGAGGLLASALIGGASSAMSGGNFMKGALLGGMSAGLGSAIGAAGQSLAGTGALGNMAASALGNSTVQHALVGGLGSVAQGGKFGEGAAMGAIGNKLGSAVSNLAGTGSSNLAMGVRTGGQTLGHMMAAGYSPKEAVLGGLAAGALTGMQVGDAKRDPYKADDVDLQMGAGASPATVPGTGIQGTNLGANMKTAGVGLALAGLTQEPSTPPPPEIQGELGKMSPAQQEYFNRPNVYWDWSKLAQDAQAAQMPLSLYLAQNWNNVAGGAYNQSKPSVQTPSQFTPAYQPEQQPVQNFAAGGLSQVARLARGGGSGRADTIPARLSDGEFIIDAETVALLGDGSTKEGARLLDEMRAKIRSHKGKALSKGQFSPNAKSPLNYIREAV